MKKMYTVFCLMLVSSICNITALCAQVNANDSLALVDLYNSTNGKHWINNTNWLTNARLDKWYGVTLVTINGKSVVYDLALGYNNLSGSIPATLGNITNLSSIDFKNNNLTGSIPAELGNLKNLHRLQLNHNKLTGGIPATLGNLTAELDLLDLSYNKLTGSIPTELVNFQFLYYFLLNNNQLSGTLPSTLGNLSKSVYYLYLNDNQFSGSIPAELGNLKNSLTYVRLNNNQLSGSIPATLGSLKVLSELYLNNNPLPGTLPPELANSEYLKILSLSDNNLTGSIPNTFRKAKTLIELNLQNNQLSGTVPKSLTSLLYLDTVRLQTNLFTFDGLEELVQHNFNYFKYSSQGKINIHQTNNMLSIYAGGTLSNNKYKWFNNGVLVSKINGDSTYIPTSSGNYSVVVTNSIATELTLKSDTVSFNAFAIVAQNSSDAATAHSINDFSVYPNPAKDVVTVSLAATGNYSLKLTDANGNILQTKTGVAINNKNNTQLDISKYAAGIYFITITNAKNETQTLRLNKQ